MNKCIYSKKTENEGATFIKQEHIIPAGIGGRYMLKQGMVSDEINEYFSKLEIEFMRKSPIAIVRQFEGPGKRGSLSPKKATKSEVYIRFDRDNKDIIGMGYIEMGIPKSIQHLIFNVDDIISDKDNYQMNMIFESDEEDYNKKIAKFIKDLEKFKKKDKYKLIYSEDIPESVVLLGICDDKWYIGINKNSNKYSMFDIKKSIHKVIDKIKTKDIHADPQYRNSHIVAKMNYDFDTDTFFRVCSKIVFNFLASYKGHEFVLQDKFNPIREWIINGGENGFVRLIESDKIPNFNNIFPEKSHRIFITKIEDKLFGYISFYGEFLAMNILLCDQYEENFCELNSTGYICDWKKKNENEGEYNLLEYISKIGG